MTEDSPALTRVVIASANPDKVAEIVSIIGTLLPHLTLVPRPAGIPDVVEDGATLADNARLKANVIAEATGEPALADDTGLEVKALAGAPGVQTARYAGDQATYEQNVQKLLEELAAAGARGRAREARFRTVVILRWPDGREIVAEGVVEGLIAAEARGNAGFGYDPVFIPDESGGRTFAELALDEKNTLSHRSRALRSLVTALAAPS